MDSSRTSPGTRLRAAVVLVDAIGFALVIGVGTAMRPIVDASFWFPLKAGAVFSLVMLVVLARIPASHPFSTLGPANQVTAVRAMFVSLVAGLVGEPVSLAAGTVVAIVSLVVTILDGVDGWLARRSGMASRFGARFDMEVDTLFILALAVLAWHVGKAGAWILLAGLLRYLFVAASWIVPRLAAPLPPSRRRQTVCIVQIFGLSVVLLPVLTPPVSGWLSGCLVAALTVSFAIDIHWLWQR